MQNYSGLPTCGKGVMLIGRVVHVLVWLMSVCLLASGVSAQTNPHAAFNGLLGTVSEVRAGSAVESSDGASEVACGSTAKACYISDVEPVVQQSCAVCHQQGLTADQQGARLLFTDDAATNHAALETFVTTDGVGADWLLGKIVGDLGHGGGPVLARGGNSYFAFADYLTLLVGANTGGGSVEASSIWSGTVMESPETTLRRAGILLAGKVPSAAAIRRAQSLKYGLKSELIALMEGEGFHDFLISGANDKLLSRGLTRGIDFPFELFTRFPAYFAFVKQIPEEQPEEVSGGEFQGRRFFTRGSAEEAFRASVVQEPLELIAHIVETDQSYKEVLTADYTMVTPISALAYRSDTPFETEIIDDQGFYDPEILSNFKPGKNYGHVPYDQEHNFGGFDGQIFEFSDYQNWPHVGVLSTPAWLGRFPSTDTNRNRARARWTYYHFLGVDIEKSAPRSTDAAALADTNNPTMNNPACTVCHERMDPVAGAYQSFGDRGHYLDQWGGMDSLPKDYKAARPPVDEIHELLHDKGADHRVHERSLSVRVMGDGGALTMSDISPRGCVQNGACSHMGVKSLTVKKGGIVREIIDAQEFESDERFSVPTMVRAGKRVPQGWLWGENGYYVDTGSWMSFKFELSPGDYEFEVELLSQMTEEHTESSITVGLTWTEGSEDTRYQIGDTWYRDMRTPGLEGKVAFGNTDSLRWLAQEIADDPRFAKATVAFWWPAIYGAEPLARPLATGLPSYGADLAAYNAQQTAMVDLAAGFVASDYRAKQLFADMISHPWYRTNAVSSTTLSAEQEVALATVGSGRLLTPEELDRKNRAVLGRTWGEGTDSWSPHDFADDTNLSAGRWDFGTFYGGIDAAAVTTRNRDLTALMAGVTQKMAVELACQAVLDDFSKPSEQRIIFTEIPRATAADFLLDDSFELSGQVPVSGNSMDHPVVSGVVTLVGGQTALRIADVTRDSYGSIDGEPSNADLIIQQIVLRRISSGETLVIDGVDLPQMNDVVFDTYIDDQGQQHIRGDVIDAAGGFWLHENAWVELLLNLPAGEYEIDLTLATSLTENHVNEAITVGVTALTIDSGGNTTTSQQIRRQMTQLLHNATTREPSDAEIDILVEALTSHADLAKGWGSDFNNVEGGCNTWEIWPDQQPSTGEQQLRYEDGDGMMRAWTMILHSLMTSYLYLHD